MLSLKIKKQYTKKIYKWKFYRFLKKKTTSIKNNQNTKKKWKEWKIWFGIKLEKNNFFKKKQKLCQK